MKKTVSFVSVDHFNSDFDACFVFKAVNKCWEVQRPEPCSDEAEADPDWLVIRTPQK